jgi:23S rRNA (pseudouridine1915-N3)-methyltransferase
VSITIAAIGKMKNGSPEWQLYKELSNRIAWKTNLQELEIKTKLSGESLKTKEGEMLLKVIPSGSTIMAMDKGGRALDSVQFARYITDLMANGKHLSFLIGGASGHSKSILDRSDMLLSLGAMTWSHMLARIMLIEQLYRAYAISTNHPYHK